MTDTLLWPGWPLALAAVVASLLAAYFRHRDRCEHSDLVSYRSNTRARAAMARITAGRNH